MMNKGTRCDSIVILTDIQAKNIMYLSIQGNLCLSNSSSVGSIHYCNKQVHLFISIFMLIVHLSLYVREHNTLVYTDDDVACTVMIDDHWCRWVKKKRVKKNPYIKKKKREKKERVYVCDDPKRPCVKEAMYAYAYILFSLAYAWLLHNSIVVIRHLSFLFFSSSPRFYASIHLSTIHHKHNS